jgi:uncharacterized membrane protein YbhN (UPF0104 family)
MLVAFTLSLAHVALRLAVLPALVYGAGAHTPLAPLIIWPLLLLYGGAIAPAPGGGGAIEFGFSLGLRKVLDRWWSAAGLLGGRVYWFYLHRRAGAVVAGTTVLRAINNSSKPPAPVPSP